MCGEDGSLSGFMSELQGAGWPMLASHLGWNHLVKAPAAQARQQRTGWHYFHLMEKKKLIGNNQKVSLIENQLKRFLFKIRELDWASSKGDLCPDLDCRASRLVFVCVFSSVCDWPGLWRTRCRLQLRFMVHPGSVLTAPQKHTPTHTHTTKHVHKQG